MFVLASGVNKFLSGDTLLFDGPCGGLSPPFWFALLGHRTGGVSCCFLLSLGDPGDPGGLLREGGPAIASFTSASSTMTRCYGNDKEIILLLNKKVITILMSMPLILNLSY